MSITPSETVFFISTADLVIDYDIMPKKTYSGASNQSRSSVRLGSEQLGSATWMPQTRDDFDPVVARSGAPYVRRVVHGNASEVKFGKGGDGTPRDYTTATSGEFGPATSVHAASYSRAAPAPGFDRATANRTNYELGETRTDYHTANEMSTQDPKHLPSPGGPDFPVSRHFSVYHGHSFASGLFPQGDGKSQESWSEAYNCYGACRRWARRRGDGRGEEWSGIMMGMER